MPFSMTATSNTQQQLYAVTVLELLSSRGEHDLVRDDNARIYFLRNVRQVVSKNSSVCHRIHLRRFVIAHPKSKLRTTSPPPSSRALAL